MPQGFRDHLENSHCTAKKLKWRIALYKVRLSANIDLSNHLKSLLARQIVLLAAKLETLYFAHFVLLESIFT
jgi:hypothetical protein